MDPMTEGYRLSPRQRRLWALHGGPAPGAASAVVRAEGPADAAALRHALLAVAERHEVLRTRFVREESAGVPVQAPGEAAVAWGVDEDWRGLPGTEAEARLAAILAAPADPAAPLQATVVRAGEETHLLVVRASPLAADLATLRALPAALALAHGGGAAEADGLQYVDVSEWQHDQAAGEDAEEGRRFWRARTPVSTPALPGVGAEEGGGEAALLRLPADPALAADAAAAAAALGISVEAALQAAFHLLLHRRTGAEAVSVAVELDGRGFEELRGAPGPFSRPVPLTTRTAPGTGADVVAGGLAEERAAALAWQDFAPEDGLPRYAFSWCQAEEPVVGAGTRFSLVAAESPAERFSLHLVCEAEAEGISLALRHDAPAVSAAAARRLTEGYRALVADLAARPHLPAGALRACGDEERREVLERLPDGGPAGTPPGTVVEWILAQAARVPERDAVVGEDRVLTYGELAALVRVRASRLRAAGVRPETPVAVLAERSADTVAWLLAVMHAGGAYLPLDPSAPAARLRETARAAGALLAVADAARAGAVAALGLPLLAGGEGDEADAGPAPELPAGRLAYVVHTSGTSGGPKGIAVEHPALAQYVAGVSRLLDVPEGARWAVVSTLAADLGFTSLFPALCGAGTLHVVPESRATDPEGWAEYAAEHGIDVLKVVPSHLRLLLDAARPERALPRARLVLGGEAADHALVERVRTLAPGCRILNHYGPTETTVGVLAGGVPEGGDPPPLGRPLPGVRAYLLDDALEPVPAGVPGEVHVGGGSLARGYLGRPALTAERFVPDPHGTPGGRLYRTGDLARWLPDGRAAFLGRADDQVKVAGHRVEPAEVAAALAAHPAVKACRVAPHAEGELVRLVAYVAAEAGEEPDPAALRRFLAERLPEPMLPAAFVFLRTLPLTPNGKLDLRALPPPELRVGGGAGTPPRTPEERRLAALWSEVLGVERVGADDDFFALGGNSFLAVRLMSRVQKETGRRVPLGALVAAGTVARMAALLEVEGAAPEHLVELAAGTGEIPLVCVHPGEGTVFCYRALAAHLDPAVPVWGIQALDGDGDPRVRVEELAARYVEALGARLPGPVRLAGWSFGGLVAFEMARRLEAAGQEVEQLLLFDCRLPVTASAFGAVDPALFRLGMLFDPRLLADGAGGARVAPEELHGLSLRAQLALVSARTGIPAEALVPAHVPPDALERYVGLRVARAEAVLAYAWGPCAAPATLFRAEEVDLDTPFPAFRDAYLRAAETPDYGWSALAAGGVEVVPVPGTHHTLFDEPNVGTLARAVEHALAAAAGGR